MKKMQWERNDILDVIESSINAAFLTEEKKEKLRKTLRDESCWTESANFRDRVHYD